MSELGRITQLTNDTADGAVRKSVDLTKKLQEERDAALARVKELESELQIANQLCARKCDEHMAEFNRAFAAERERDAALSRVGVLEAIVRRFLDEEGGTDYRALDQLRQDAYAALNEKDNRDADT